MNKLYRLFRYDWPLHFTLLLTNWLPDNVPCLWLRGFLAHFFIGSCGENLRLGRNISFYNPSKIHLGNRIYIAFGCWFMAGEDITIEDEVIFGPYGVIASSNHQFSNNSFRYGSAQQLPINIGKGSWVGAHVTVTAGANIGSGCLVAAGAVLTNRRYADHQMIAGVPAREIKTV